MEQPLHIDISGKLKPAPLEKGQLESSPLFISWKQMGSSIFVMPLNLQPYFKPGLGFSVASFYGREFLGSRPCS